MAHEQAADNGASRGAAEASASFHGAQGGPAAVRLPAVRHWKMRFDPRPQTEYVWARPRVFGGVRVNAGDPVDRSKIKLARLQALWQARFVRIANWDPAGPLNPVRRTPMAATAADQPIKRGPGRPRKNPLPVIGS